MAIGSSSPQAIDRLCKKASALLSSNPSEAQRLALDAHQRLIGYKVESPAERRRMAGVLLLLARCAWDARQPDTAAVHAREALDVLDECNARRERAEASHILGLVAWRAQGNRDQAITLFQQSLELLSDGTQPHLRCRVLCDVGSLYGQGGEFEQALPYLEKCVTLATTAKCYEYLGRALKNIGNIHNITSNPVLALEYFQKSFAIVEQFAPDNAASKGALLLSMGALLMDTGNYDRALEYWMQSLQLLEEAGLHKDTASVLANIGVLYKRNGVYEEALEYLYRSLAVIEQNNLHESHPGALQNISSVLLKLHQYEESLEYAKRSYTVAVGLGNRHKAQYALHAMSGALFALGQVEEGLERLWEGYSISQELQYDKGIISIGAEIGAALGNAGRPQEGLENALAALALAEQLQQKPLLLGTHTALATLYEMVGNHELALYHHKAMHELNTAIFNEDAARRMQVLRILHQVDEAKREAEIYKLRTTHLQQQMEDQKRMIMAKTMYVEQHTDVLVQIKKSLTSVAETTDGDTKKKLQDILSTVREALPGTESWSSFEEQFQYTFVEGLQKQYPQLSKVELRVCSLIRLNLSSKEMCRILNIAPRSVDMHRYRIRKKLELSSEANLAAILAEIPHSIPPQP